MFKLLMSYGLVFLLAYYAIMIFIGHRSMKYKNYYIGILLAIITSFQIYVIKIVSYNGIPDGKFLLAGFTAFIWGIGPGLIVATAATITKHALDGMAYHTLIILFGVSITIFRTGKFLFKKYNIHENFWTYSFLSILMSISVLMVASKIGSANLDYIIAIKNPVSIVLLSAIIVSAMFDLVKRELNEIKLIESLEAQKSELYEQKVEIQALYEEVLASEETLKSNYDEMVRYQEKIEFLAYHESQTGFSNKEHLYKAIREYKINKSKALVVLEILDRNKLNHTIGNTMFEILHFTIGAELQRHFEAYTTSEIYSLGIGRYGLLISQLVSEDTLNEVFIALNENFLKNKLVNTFGLTVDLYAGAVKLDKDNVAPELWVEYAEAAMLMSSEATNVNKIIWFQNSYYEKLQIQTFLVTNLKKAIKNEEFYVVYQPKFDANGQIKSAEALLRWHNAEFGDIAPYLFIPLAETNGVIGEIGDFVLNSVCKMIKAVDLIKGRKIPIAINASIIEILNPQYADKVFSVLKSYEIDPTQIQIEVTESTISDSYEEVIETLSLLSKGNIEIHLDDFGTGYSSLSHIGIMPISVIKIDKKFIDQIFLDKKYENLVEMMIDFSHRTNIKVVAEGVEDASQLEWLKSRNCDFYQGYYFSKPISGDALLKLIETI